MACWRWAVAILVLGSAAVARAAPPPLAVPSGADVANPAGGAGSTVFLGDLQRSNYLLGDLFGLRTQFAKAGISLAIQETSEALGNATGGARQAVAYDGLTQAILQLDTQRAFGWYGGLFNVSALQLHGRDLSDEALLLLQTASGIEGERATRLWELWYEQKLLAEDRLDLRVGLLSVDQEFIVNPDGAYFVNSAFGWPLVPALDLPGGGPAAPLSALGGRLRVRPVDAVNVLFGAFSGDPAASTQGDAQLGNASGTSFPTNDGVFLIGELQYVFPAVGALVEPDEGAPLGYTYRLGAWYHSGRFADQRFAAAGGSLAGSGGPALPHRGDFAVYAAADRMVWRNEDHPNQNVSLFARAVGAPQSDRNLIDVSFDGGAVVHGPMVSRPEDMAGVGLGLVHVSRAAAALDGDAGVPVRGSEVFVEATYQAQVTAWWQVQPDAQYVFCPGGGILNPNNTAQRAKNELIFDLRTNILF